MNNRQTTIITHIASWAVLMLVPMMSMGYSEGQLSRHLMMSAGVTLSFMAVFYISFLWVTPRYFSKATRRYYVLLNLLFIVLTAFALHEWMELCNSLYPSPRHHGGFKLAFVLRDMFNLSIVALIATAMHLAMRWQRAEQARSEAEAARIDAELKTLRYQINPHFLLNTLNNIYALTAIDSERAQQAIQQLSKMMRHLLYDNEQPTVPLQDEVEFLENYTNLMRLRLSSTIDVQMHTNIHTPQQPVAPMIFISLLENAFKHGISPTLPSFVHMTLTADEHTITCDIENSNHPKSEQDQSGHGIGLQQVRRRLELAYPGHYSWQQGVGSNGTTYRSCITIVLDPESNT